MKRWCIVTAVCLAVMMPSTALASSEVRLSSEDGGWRAEVWHDGRVLVRFVLAEALAVWRADDDDKTILASPLVEDGMLKLIIR